MILQQRQIVVKGLGKQKDIEYPVCIKYAGTSFHSIAWMLISAIVPIYRNTSVSSQRYQGSHSILLTTN
jgi:hypothetical protein